MFWKLQTEIEDSGQQVLTSILVVLTQPGETLFTAFQLDRLIFRFIKEAL